MKAVLVRVGADQSAGGGHWNGPVEASSGQFAYVAIPESQKVHPGLERPYAWLTSALRPFGMTVPEHLAERHMHLDPDFVRLSYGDQGQRAKQLGRLEAGDWVVFYAGLRDIGSHDLVYGIIGLLVIETLLRSRDIADRDFNAHTRRELGATADDLVVVGKPGSSGRLDRCLPIGEYRAGAYRVRPDLLERWGGLSVKDGYIQRSGRLPWFSHPQRFVEWFAQQNVRLLPENNPEIV